MNRGKDTPQPNPDGSGMTIEGQSKRRLLTRLVTGASSVEKRRRGANGVAGNPAPSEEGSTRLEFIAGVGTGIAATLVGQRFKDALPHRPHLGFPDALNPFDRELKEKTLRAAITGITEYAQFISHVAKIDVKVQVEKDAKYLDMLFDSKATAEVSIAANITSDFSAFFPPTGEEMDHPTTTLPSLVADKAVQPLVGMVGVVPALEISDDLKTLTVTLPNPKLPPVGEFLPNFAKVKIKYGKGGLEDRIENWTGTSSIRDTELYMAAQRAALKKLSEDPTVLPKAKERIAKLLRSLLGAGGNYETININFVDPNEKPDITKTQLIDPRVQTRVPAGH